MKVPSFAGRLYSWARHYPHPEHCAGAAHDYCRSHTCQIARADTAGDGYSEGLERGDAALAVLAAVLGPPFGQQTQHLRYRPELKEAGTHCEPYCTDNEYAYQQVGPDDVIRG